jgi:hypothetical protein
MVIGQTPQLLNASAYVSTYDPDVVKKYPYTTRINSVCGNRIYRIDTMMSRGFNIGVNDYREVQFGRLNALEINFNPDGSMGEELLKKDYLVSVKKGVKKGYFNVVDFNLRMQKNGIFVGFEKLIIEKNKLEKEVVDSNTKATAIQKMYFPYVLYNYVERDFIYTFSGGKWNKQTKQDIANPSDKMRVYEPAINLILTN